METTARKLIDLEPSVIRIINCKARMRNMSFKRYVEELITKDAKSIDSNESAYSEIQSQELLSLIGIAKDVKADGTDDKLDYILSKL